MRVLAVLVLIVSACYAAHSAPSVSRINDVTEDKDSSAPTTHELLSKLGMKKLHIPDGHHKKRLAEQARRRITGDSRMYIIKLPPNTNFYSHVQPASLAARKLHLAMTSNGKPGRIYHWNIPFLEKMATESFGRPQARLDEPIVDVEGTPTWKNRPHPNAIDSPAYYVPAKPKKASFRKYFPGNGKPKSFYIIEKSKKSKFHKLLP